MGIGIGIVFTTIIMMGVKVSYNMSDYQVEKRARAMGMKYPSEVKVIINGGMKK